MDNHDELERVLDETDGRIQHLKDLLVSEQARTEKKMAEAMEKHKQALQEMKDKNLNDLSKGDKTNSQILKEMGEGFSRQFSEQQAKNEDLKSENEKRVINQEKRHSQEIKELNIDIQDLKDTCIVQKQALSRAHIEQIAKIELTQIEELKKADQNIQVIVESHIAEMTRFSNKMNEVEAQYQSQLVIVTNLNNKEITEVQNQLENERQAIEARFRAVLEQNQAEKQLIGTQLNTASEEINLK